MQRCAVLGLVAVLTACSSPHADETAARFDLATPRARSAPRGAPSPAGVVVYVAGEVAHPGVYRLASGRRVVDALALAGNARPDADLVAVNLAELLRDGEEIAVGAKGEPRPRTRSVRQNGTARSPRTRTRAPHRSRKRATVPSSPLDLNTADAQSLAALPGLGIGLAERIVQFRDANGPFDSVDELADVAGITDRRLEQLSPYLTVNGR